jgi:hypothetical protein
LIDLAARDKRSKWAEVRWGGALKHSSLEHYLAESGAPIAAAAFLSASVEPGAGWFDIASSAFLSAAAEAAAAGRFFPVSAVPEFCADGDWIRANAVTEAAATNKNLLRSTLIMASRKRLLDTEESRIIPEVWPVNVAVHII